MIKTKKLLCGFELPVLGQGTWGTGGRDTADPNADDEQLAAVIRHGVSLGFTRIDTAEMYAAGHSEELVGKAIAGLDRGSLFITSKVWKTHLHADDVLKAAENSLKRLKTDYMDLFLIHHVNPDIPLEDTMRGMDAVVKHGFARAIGVSNFSLQRFQKAQACSSNKLVLNQVHYNLIVRECEPQLLPWCQANDVMLEAWRPLRNLTPCPLMDEMREKYNATAAQIALAFLLQQKNVVTITAMRSIAHMPENLAALQLSLEEEDLERLRREYPGQLAVSPTVPL